MKRRLVSYLGIAILVALCALTLQPGAVRAGVNDVLLGARSSSADPIDPGSVNAGNFTDYFTNNGASPSLTIGASNGGAMIGAIWWIGAPQEQWAQMRIVIDSNRDGTYDPFNWGDPSHPWNMTTGTGTIPF